MYNLLSLLAAAAAVHGSPVPQGVTQNISPAGGMPAGCMASRAGTFGIAIVVGTDAANAPAATQIADGQAQAPPVNQIGDGQIQAMTQISDGQIQAPIPTCAASQISDGQVQGCVMPMPAGPAATQIADGQVQAPTMTAAVATQLPDGQPQAPTAAVATQISDGQPQAPPAPVATQISDGQPQAPPVPVATQISDGQPQAPAATQVADGQVQSPGMTGTAMTACNSAGTLALTLANGVLHDAQGRTGYIAANYQFQFDAPAQTGAIYTAGWSVCENNALALGPSKVFYRCRSGGFYNLYNENWAPQCEAVTIMAVDLVDCA